MREKYGNVELIKNRNSIYLKRRNEKGIIERKYLWVNNDFTDFGERVYRAIKEWIDKIPEEKREYTNEKMIKTLFEYNIISTTKMVIIPITAENNTVVGWCAKPEKEIFLTSFGKKVYEDLKKKYSRHY